MSSLNEQGFIFESGNKFINQIRSSILYSEKVKDFKKYLEGANWDSGHSHVLVYSFDEHDFIIGALETIKQDFNGTHSFVILAYGVNWKDEISVNPKSYW